MALYRKSTALGFGFGLLRTLSLSGSPLCGWLRNVYCLDGRMNHEIVKGVLGREKKKVKRWDK